MFALVLIGNLGFSLASLVLGLRLCLLAQKTRQAPETLLGISFLSGGFLASTLGWVLYTPARPSDPLVLYLTFMLLRACVALAGILLLIVTWRVFRPHSRIARVVVLVLSGLMVTYVFTDLRSGRVVTLRVMSNPFYIAESIAVMAPYFWLTYEAFVYQMRIRLRWRIGLPADLVVAARMRLWAIGIGAEATMFLVLEVVRLIGALTGRPVFPALLVSTLGMFCAACLWLAFFLPESYRKRIERESTRATAA